jgi:redox-sensitive bicupin YhaK (pirin superfamily)
MAADPGADGSAAPAKLRVRRDSEIYGTDGGWFQARWHFSFDQYFDLDNMGIGQLRVFNHDTLVPGAVWPRHPHRDVEGLTYVVAGHFEHADSLGNGGVLEAGGAQRMTLGRGALHSERNHSKTEAMQFIQMWILPAERGLEPSVEQRQFTREDRTNRLLRIMRPEGSDGEGVPIHQDASVFVARLEPGRSIQHDLPEGHVGYFYLIDGAARVNGEELAGGDAAKILTAGRLDTTAHEVSELLLVDTV